MKHLDVMEDETTEVSCYHYFAEQVSIDRVQQVAWTEMTGGLQTDRRRDSRHL